MLLTRKTNASVTSQQIRLSKGLSSVLAKTIDRRTFLKRSGMTAGAGIAGIAGATAAVVPGVLVAAATTGVAAITAGVVSAGSVDCAAMAEWPASTALATAANKIDFFKKYSR